MIPKPLNEIEWSDIEVLRDCGREEDDTIEFKGSFKGGSNFLEFNDGKQAAAVDAVAKEAIAFLNSRGGDILIGVKEFENDHPKIEAITPVANAHRSLDRLAQSLAAIIEPAQSALTFRAVSRSADSDEGVIIVRAQSSLRAPHRSKRVRECYIRRGRESVPMPMDEVQDLSVRRADLRKERRTKLDGLLNDVSSDRVGRVTLPEKRFRVRAIYMPLVEKQISIDDDLCRKLLGYDPVLRIGGQKNAIGMPFRNLGINFRPILRGRRIENFLDRSGDGVEFLFCYKDIHESGVVTADFSCHCQLSNNEFSKYGLFQDWIAGYAANALVSIKSVIENRPELSDGYLGVAFYASKDISSSAGNGVWSSDHLWPEGVIILPIFEIGTNFDLVSVFAQIQVDANAILGIDSDSTWRMDT